MSTIEANDTSIEQIQTEDGVIIYDPIIKKSNSEPERKYQKLYARHERSDGRYGLKSYWTSSQTVEFNDGQTLEEWKSILLPQIDGKGDGLDFDLDAGKLYLYSDDKKISTTEINVRMQPRIELDDILNLNIRLSQNKIRFTWEDPEDIIFSELPLIEWAGTKVIRKTGSAPDNVNDGTLIIDSKTKNNYSQTPYYDETATAGLFYYYRFFPYDKNGNYYGKTCGVIYKPTTLEPVNVPTPSEIYTYNNTTITPVFDGFDSTKMTKGGATSAKNVGTYTITFTLREGYCWNDLTTEPKDIEWIIQPAKISIVPFQNGTLTYNGSSQTPVWNNYDNSKLDIVETAQTNAGTYSSSFTPKSNYTWSDGTVVAKTAQWSIEKEDRYITIGGSTSTQNINIYIDDTDNLELGGCEYGYKYTLIGSVADNGEVTMAIENNILSITGNSVITGISFTIQANNVPSGLNDNVVYHDCNVVINVKEVPFTYSIDGNNGQWIEIENNIWKSDAGSYHISNGLSRAIVTFRGYIKFAIQVRNYSESNYDYVLVGDLDVSNITRTGTNKYSNKGKSSATQYYSVEFEPGDLNVHSFEIIYSKDGSADSNDDRGYFYIDEENCITPVVVCPTQKDTLYYNGETQTPEWDNYKQSAMVISGTTSGTNVGNYTVSFILNSGYEWDDGTTEFKTVTWKIDKGRITTIPEQKGYILYDGSSHSPEWKNYNSSQLILSGDTSGSALGTYHAIFTPTSNYVWDDGSEYKSVEWEIVDEIPEPNALKFSSDSAFTLKLPYNKVWDGIIEYSTDNGDTWTVCNGNEQLSGNENQNIYLRGTGNTVITQGYSWTFTGKYCTSNIETLLDYQTVENGGHPVMGENCYEKMFYNQKTLVIPPELPATTLNYACYRYMFKDCTSLTTTPELPATTLNYGCYNGMFENCTSLTTAPELPATTLSNQCYHVMFYGCTSLITIPELPATKLFLGCYQGMFYGCTSLKLSTTQTEEYQYEYRIPISGNGTTTTDALTNMFTNTGGTFTGAPTINTTYYTDHQPV